MEDKIREAEDRLKYTYEGMMSRQERTIKRLWILCIVIFLAFVGSNAGWIWYESQFEDVVMTQEATTDGGGDVNVSGVGSGTINNYGTCETDNQG